MVFSDFSTTNHQIFIPIFLLETDIPMQILSTEPNLTEFKELK